MHRFLRTAAREEKMAKDRDKLERDRLVLEEKRLNLQGGKETRAV